MQNQSIKCKKSMQNKIGNPFGLPIFFVISEFTIIKRMTFSYVLFYD